MGQAGALVFYAYVLFVGVTHAPLAVSEQQAASPVYLDEADLLGDIPVVTAGTRLKQKPLLAGITWQT